MTQPDFSEELPLHEDLPGSDDIETNLTSAADVASAGRSCLIIMVLLGLIVILLLAWVLFTTTGGNAKP